MEIENEVVELEGQDEDIEPVNDTTNWEARAKKLEEKAIVQRERTKELKARLAKLEKATPSKDAATEHKQPDNYAELAYLAAKGIESDAEIALVREATKDTGKSLRELLTSKWFQAELKDLRDQEAAKKATPTGSRRPSGSAHDDVSYWIDKPMSEVPKEMKSKVLNERISREKARKGTFTDTPVA